MEIRYANKSVKKLVEDSRLLSKTKGAVVAKLVPERLRSIELAPEVGYFEYFNQCAGKFKQLTGNRAGQCAFRLGQQFRLVFRITKQSSGRTIAVIEEISKHYEK